MAELETARLRLRQWRPDDLELFARLNADPEVMRYFPSPLTREESDRLALGAQEAIASRGWGLWAVEVTDEIPFIGFVGLAEPRFEAHFTPALEVGWRLDRPFWGHGYATEGGRAALAFAFQELGREEVVSFTTVLNEPSRRVMERLGMTRNPEDDFDHPLVDDPRVRPHVLYRLGRVAGNGPTAVAPPSSTRLWPLTCEERGEARKTTASATSRDSPGRPVWAAWATGVARRIQP